MSTAGGLRVGHPFWSLTAYYFGVGAYITPTGYGFIGFPWLFLVLLALSGVLIFLVQWKDRLPETSERPDSAKI